MNFNFSLFKYIIRIVANVRKWRHIVNVRSLSLTLYGDGGIAAPEKNIVHEKIFAILGGVGDFSPFLFCLCRKRVACHYIKDSSDSSRTVKTLICVRVAYKG